MNANAENTQTPQPQWEQIAKFGKRRYFRDTVSGRVSQVGDSGPSPSHSEDGILWLDTSGNRPICWDGFGSVPVISANGGSAWIGADTIAECEWVAKTFGLRTKGFPGAAKKKIAAVVTETIHGSRAVEFVVDADASLEDIELAARNAAHESLAVTRDSAWSLDGSDGVEVEVRS